MTARDRAARQLLGDETIKAAFDAVLSSLEASLWNAATPEDREARFQERQGLVRVRQRLSEWASSDALRQEKT